MVCVFRIELIYFSFVCSFVETLRQSPLPPPAPPLPPVFHSNTPTKPIQCQVLLPHQDVNLIVKQTNLTEIQARSIPSIFLSNKNIWTRCVLTDLRIKQTIFDQHFGDTNSSLTIRSRRTSVSVSSLGGGQHMNLNDDGPLSFVLLDATSRMLYDVPMRHLLQLVKKDYDDDASIDHVIRAIDQAQMKSEWLDAVIALNKQFDKRPEDKVRVLAHQGSTNGLVLIEQFFVKLVRVPSYELKLIYLKFREEAPTQLERMNKHINDLLEAIQSLLTNEQLPGILHLLCLLYNSITGKTIPGLHFDSLLSVLSIRTLKQNTTLAHLLCHLFDEQYSHLLEIFNNQLLLKLKDLSLIKYVPIYVDIRCFYARYQQLNNHEHQLNYLPEHMKTTLNDLDILFCQLFEHENLLIQGEKDLSTYFCACDLTLDNCLSTVGQFIDKLRLAHMQNLQQMRRTQILTKQRAVQTPLRYQRNPSQSISETNIFRDHLAVQLTPITSRQRTKVNRLTRDRYASSRDVLYDDQQEQIHSNSLARKRGHSPATKIRLTKRPFHVLPASTIHKPQEQRVEFCFRIRFVCFFLTFR